MDKGFVANFTKTAPPSWAAGGGESFIIPVGSDPPAFRLYDGTLTRGSELCHFLIQVPKALPEMNTISQSEGLPVFSVVRTIPYAVLIPLVILIIKVSVQNRANAED
jgi:hypothetical protein